MTRISVKYPIIGAKVVRGRDWNHGNQDGGEGNIGTIVEKSGRNQWVEVKWKECNTNLYRIGNEGRYDLYFATEKDALLQEAMERFPSGCSYIGTSEKHYKNIEYDYPYWYDEKMIALKEDEGLVYKDGVWAERTDSDNPSLVDQAKKLFTVNTVFSNTNLGFRCTDIKIIKPPEFEIRKDQILIKDGGCNDPGAFTIYKDGKWAEIVSVKEERREVFPGIYVGDIVVSLTTVHEERKDGDILKVLKASTKGRLHYKDNCYSLSHNDWRLATSEEIRFYNNGGKNINDMTKKELSPLEKCKQMYSVGDVVETTIDGESHVEKITQEILDELSEYSHDSISCMYLKGWLYYGKTKQYAKIISNDFHSQTKTNQNGKHKQDTEVRSFKVQRSNLSIPTGIRTGGSGLKSADRKVGFRSNGSNYQERFGSC